MCHFWRRYTQRSGLHDVHKVIYIFVYDDLDLWPLTLKINRNHPLIRDIICIKFNEDTFNDLVSMLFTILFPYLSTGTLSFDPWPWRNWSHTLIMVKICGKFDQDACNCIVSIAFTRWCDGWTDTMSQACTHRSTEALLYPLRNALRRDMNTRVWQYMYW